MHHSGKDAKTLFEYFLALYSWFDEQEGHPADSRRTRSLTSWRAFRRAHSDCLQMDADNAAVVQQFIPEDFTALHGGSPTTVFEDTPMDTSSSPLTDLISEDEDEEEEEEEIPQSPPCEAEEEEEEGEDDEEQTPSFAKQYAKHWVKEIALDIGGWTPKEVAEFILSLARKGKCTSKPRLEAVAKAVIGGSVDGSLLLAGGADILVERTVGYVKWDKGTLKREANGIIKHLLAAKSASELGYFERNKRVKALYETSDLIDIIKTALLPCDLADVRYTTLSTRVSGDRCCTVTGVDDDVCNLAGNSPQIFKVVSVVTPETPMEVNHNMIYFKDKRNVWTLLCSVDFMAHGDAPPGHWHFNRAPLGELVPHWGPGNNVFHGSPEACPVWWHLIPVGMKYRTTPERSPLFSWAS